MGIDHVEYVVGIGASAGGLEALERFLSSTKKDERLAYVIIQHLSPNFKSLMKELLAQHTNLEILQAADRMPLKPNTIYLIPPKMNLTLEDRRIRLQEQERQQRVNLPINIFFQSLAQEMQERAIGIVLSGTGSDGSEGILAIQSYNGLVMVQEPDSAEFAGMPTSAIRTNAVDIVAPPDDMPLKIQEYIRSEANLKELSDVDLTILREENALSLIFALLRRQYNIDFGEYKTATMLRRVERRILYSEFGDIFNYLKVLRQNKDELDQLFRDLLVEVTHFFRDQEAFRNISSQVVPELVEAAAAGQLAGGDQTVRVWVPGCATGEEAYSLAILFHEYITLHQKSVQVKIFATDVHQQSLDFGSRGVYPADKLASLPKTYMDRYFVSEGSAYVIAHDIRKMVIFAHHNLIEDPPFTRLNLITCRNVLIYFRPSTQKKVMTHFHFALRKGGVLFLGPSENTNELSDEFTVVDRRWRIYKKNRDVQLAPTLNVKPQADPNKPLWSDRFDAADSAPTSGDRRYRPKMLAWEKELLNQYVPSGFLVDHEYNAIHIFGDAAKYLKPTSGRVTFNLFNMLENHFHLSIRAALHRASQAEPTVSYQGVRLENEDGTEAFIRVTVKLIDVGESGETFYMIALEPDSADQPAEPYPMVDASLKHMRLLEQDLQFTKEHLQMTIEELETTNEELQSTNEELIASNEELQSTNEELHSVNEELYTVNSEYQLKINELTKLNDDMKNLQRSSRVRILFLDQHMRIRDFTPEMASTFNLLPQDVGRPIEHLLYNFNASRDEFTAYIQSVLDGGKPISKEILAYEEQRYLVQVLPYQLETGVIEGVVLYLTDISELKSLEVDLLKNQKRFHSLLNHMRRPVFYHNTAGELIYVNLVLGKLLGQDYRDLTGKNLRELVSNGDELGPYFEAVDQDQPPPRVTLHFKSSDGSTVQMVVDSLPIFDKVGRLIEYMGIGEVPS